MGKKEKRKREPSVVPEEEPAEEEGFQVEVITHARVKDANLEDPWEYRVKWAGYASDEDSWEPAENVAACQRLLDSFWTEIGLDNEDYPEGYVAKASKEWIKKERKRFKAEFAKNKEEERKQKERAERRKEDALTKKAAKKKKQSVEKQKSTASVPSRSASTSSVPQRNSQSSVSSYPAPPPSTSALPPPKKKAKLFTSDPEDSEDDRPLSSLGKKRKLSAKAGDDKQTKVRKTQDKTSVSATSSTKVKNFESSKGKKSAPPSRAPSPTAKAKDVESNNNGKSASALRAVTPPTKPKDNESVNNGKKSAPPSRAPSPLRNESSNKGEKPTSRPPTPPADKLFSPSPEPHTSPEISLSSLNPKPKPTTKLPERSSSESSNAPRSKARPKVSINTELPAASPTIPSAISKGTSLPKPTPLPLPRRTVSSNPASASSTSFPSRPFAKTTPTIASATPTSAASPIIPSAKPVSPKISSAKPATPVPPSALPAFPQRKGSSRGPLLPPPPNSGSGLSTKQRLAQGALNLAPTNTKEAPRKSLAGMSFKKNSSLTGSTPAAASGSTSRVAPVQKSKPPPRPAIDPLFDDPDDQAFNTVDSPVDLSTELDDQPILPPALSRRRPQLVSTAQADDFLKDIMPPKLAAPFSASLDKPDLPNPPRLGAKPKMLPQRPIPKKWRWNGKLLMDVTDKKDEPTRTDHLCDVVLNELFPPTVEGPQINVVMTSVESLHLPSFYDLMDMSEFLKTSGVRMNSPVPLQQLARLGPSTEKDVEPLKILARYMTKKNFVSLMPTFLDGDLVGHLLLFPPVIGILGRMLKVPDELLKSSSLVAALLPWKPFPEESRRPFGLVPPPTKPPVPSEADWKKTMTKSKYQLALRILKFPKDLHEWFSRPSRTYCIWPPSEERQGNRDRETGYLISILKECGAKQVGFKTDMRAIFVHVGALKSIRKMSLLVERRQQTCGIRFYTFGTHETVHPEHWGVREIYPLGGVVTFTASALFEDPWGVIKRIKSINVHPLWTCYILPSVFGMATRLCSQEEDPLAAFDRDEFVFDRLLKAIDYGEVSVLRAPLLDRNATRTSDPATDWLRDHWINRPLGPRQVLESSMNAFSAKYSNIPQPQWASAIEAEISADLDLMQMQPDIMNQYRRYVVIKAETDNHIEADRDGFEWLTNSTFSFDDNFLSNPQKTADPP